MVKDEWNRSRKKRTHERSGTTLKATRGAF